MKKNIAFFLLFMSIINFAQTPPPPEVEITPDKKILVDQLIEITHFEEYIKSYCIDVIQQVAQANNWSDQQKDEISNSNFKFFNRSIYYYFIKTPNTDITNLIKAYKKINSAQSSKKQNLLIPFSTGIRKDLEFFILDVLKGLYKLNEEGN
ncbi:hypothetical protein ACFO4P_00515 [Epilithonimonas pallida]|uniref:Uncharacterized protein n=1 Tax=Epilithonimonas pallida TaxID=373671 RepID=A0ABY1R708_9FLAO|nr:hypothetical protein [Epilithonimonas pallida]SMP97454.1 hypothetical protein SAMN05421679_11334 [Epilithonimonas pallida]